MIRLILSVVMLSVSLEVGAAADEPSKPIAVHSGADSKVTKPQYKVIASDKEWQSVWASHLGTSVDDAYRQAFEVDFDKCMVVAILRGNQINIRGITIDEVDNKSDAVV